MTDELIASSDHGKLYQAADTQEFYVVCECGRNLGGRPTQGEAERSWRDHWTARPYCGQAASPVPAHHPLPSHATPLAHCRTHLFALSTIEQATATVASWQRELSPHGVGTLLAAISLSRPTCCPAASFARYLTMAAARTAGGPR